MNEAPKGALLPFGDGMSANQRFGVVILWNPATARRGDGDCIVVVIADIEWRWRHRLDSRAGDEEAILVGPQWRRGRGNRKEVVDQLVECHVGNFHGRTRLLRSKKMKRKSLNSQLRKWNAKLSTCFTKTWNEFVTDVYRPPHTTPW